MNSHKHQEYKNRIYDIVDYNPQWPLLFKEYAAKVQQIFPEAHIEHVGSTSIPEMSGKSAIDLLITVKDLAIIEEHIKEMEQAGFEYHGQFVMEGSRLFRLKEGTTLRSNIHFFIEGHPHIGEMVRVRNYLRTHPEERKTYSDLKKELYAKHADDYASYRKYKDEYVEQLQKRVDEYFQHLHN